MKAHGLKIATLLLATALLHVGASAGSNTIYNFLRNDVSARAAALAGSFVSVSDDPNALFYNPAGLSTLATPMGSVGFFKHLLDINAGYISYSQPFEGIGYFGVGVLYTDYGSFSRIDELGNINGSFHAGDLAVTIGYADRIQENVHLGANVKYIFSSIADYNSSGIAADMGLLVTIPESRASVGVSVRNLGVQLTSYLNAKEDLPLDVVVGGSITPRGLPLLFNLNFHKLNEDVKEFGDRFRAFSVGGEFTLSSVLQFRVGYNNEQRRELKIGTTAGIAGFTGGLGITAGGYKVDYALSSLGKIGELHRISIGTSF